jgi:GlpG protein
MQLALKLSVDIDLGDYSRLLWQHKISHQITSHEDSQFVLVAGEAKQVAEAQQLFTQWQAGHIKPRNDDSSDLGSYFKPEVVETEFFRALVRAPLTLTLIAVCCLMLYLAPLAEPTTWTYALMFPDFSYGTRLIVMSTLLENFSIRQFFNMLTPALLHGGLVHLAFNMMWTWELGKRIEQVQSTLNFACTLVVLAMFSNTIQYLWGGANNFGGMSGVVYGLFAYIWMWQLFDPKKGLNLPVSLIIFMLLSLAVMTYLGLSMIANAAHMGGFLTGIVYGAVVAIFSRVTRAGKRSQQQ